MSDTNNINRNDQNVSSHYFLGQNSHEICNDGKIQDESFNFQGFFENDAKQMNTSLNVDLNNSQKKTKMEGFKNAYINKINHLKKNIKKKPNDLQKK